MNKNRLKIAYITTGSDNFYSKEYSVHSTHLTTLLELSKKIDFDLENIEKEIQTRDDVKKYEEVIKPCDALLIMCGGFSDGNLITEFERYKKPLLFWSLTEPLDTGDIQLHSYITKCIFSGIAKKCFGTMTYYSLDGDAKCHSFQSKLENIIRAMETEKMLSCTKILQIGDGAYGFLNLDDNPNDLADKFGVSIFHATVKDVVDVAKQIEETEIQEIFCKLSEDTYNISVSEDTLMLTCRVYLALKKLAVQGGYNALAVSCWSEFQEYMRMVPCLAMSMLMEFDGITVSCEGDIGGVISMLILKGLSKSQPTLMDITQIDEKSNAMLLWHCGFSPMSLAEGKINLINHPMLNRKKDESQHMGVAQDFVMHGEDFTVLRVSGNNMNIFSYSGKKITNKGKGFKGVRVWLSDCEMQCGKVEITTLSDVLLSNGVEHHVALCRGNMLHRINNFVQLKGINMIGGEK
ncbi:MAG: hypothetical protein R3Y36_00770 [Spirochaetales bacterium]